MKICMVAGIFPPEIGGPATQAAHLCRALLQRGIQPVVVTLAARSSVAEEDGMRVYRFPLRAHWLGRAGDFASFCARLIGVLRAERPDVIHCHDAHLRSLLAGVVARVMGIPSVVKYAGDFVWETVNADQLQTRSLAEAHRAGLGARALAAVQRVGLRAFDVVWATSQYRRRMLVDVVGVPAARVRVIPNFIRLPSVPERVPSRGGAVRSITTGRFAPHKRLEVLIDAFARLAQRDVTLEIVGGGDADRERAVAEHITRRELDGRVTMHGRVPYSRLVELLAQSDLYVSTSVEEGFGISFVEAMACGLPILAMQTTAIPEVVPHGTAGYLVDPDDRDAFVQRWREFIASPEERVALGRAAQAHAQQYDLERGVEQFVSLYRELASGRPAARQDPLLL